MAKVTASAERVVDAPADTVYGYLADQHQHPRFLPPAFTDFEVIAGGVGAGSETRYKIPARGSTRELNMQVSEPEPGRTLVESDKGSSLVTTFTVTPQGEKSLVNITTQWDGAGGIGGFFERTFAPRALHRLYTDELDGLSTYATQQQGA
ncbi:MAG TPA: SRPBCC family protein [Trebonia sp.]|jgi:uncharacterized protein YndB with AHSA1/START domain